MFTQLLKIQALLQPMFFNHTIFFLLFVSSLSVGRYIYEKLLQLLYSYHEGDKENKENKCVFCEEEEKYY